MLILHRNEANKPSDNHMSRQFESWRDPNEVLSQLKSKETLVSKQKDEEMFYKFNSSQGLEWVFTIVRNTGNSCSS